MKQLFKAKTIDGDRWAYGFFVKMNGKAYIFEGDSFVEVNQRTVCQMIGHLDAKGKPIYEGDILENINTKLRYKIVWQYTRTRYAVQEMPHGYKFRFTKEDADLYRVIGNVHDGDAV